MPHPYQIFDVFTDTPLTGNPLAVVFEADDLDHDRCQAIAAEFNLSETIFLSTPKHTANTAAGRIFTPEHEMVFAGHPTVGGTIALAPGGGTVRLELPAGLVTAEVLAVGGGALGSAFLAPRLPSLVEGAPAADVCARMLGIAEGDIGSGAMRPCRATSGPGFTVVPVESPLALERVTVDIGLMRGTLGTGWTSVYVVAALPDGSFQVRMFAPLSGIAEDPATGSAAVAFASVLEAAGLDDGRHEIAIRQGAEMGRPSTIRIAPTVEDGRLVSVELSGEAVLVAEGTLLI